MPRKELLALAVSSQNAFVSLRGTLFHPREQRRPEVEADASVVVDDFFDTPLPIEYARGAVWQVTLGSDALIPVVVRTG